MISNDYTVIFNYICLISWSPSNASVVRLNLDPGIPSISDGPSTISDGPSATISQQFQPIWGWVKTTCTPSVHIKIAGIYGCSSP